MPPAVAAGAHGTDGACNRHRGRRISIGMQAAQTIDPAADAAAHERALVEGVLAGMPGAFERLVRDHQGLCWHVIQRMVRHPEDTRELCQEAFLRSEEHTSELQSIMRNSYAVFCLKKKTHNRRQQNKTHHK